MVAGFIPPLRTLLISDRLIDELPRDQVAMVVLHEAAHLRRFHVPIRMLTIVPAWLLGGFITRLANGHSWGILAGSIVAIALTMIGLRIAAFRTELDADLHACRMAVDMADQIECVPASYQQASAALSSALLRITLEHPGARKATWLHPSVSERIASMQRHGVLQTTPNIPTNAIAQ
jgi:Zn-dependent protease with chaperone function